MTNAKDLAARLREWCRIDDDLPSRDLRLWREAADLIEQQAAEIAALTKANKRFKQRELTTMDRMFDMEKEIERLRADAERYRWLRAQDDWRYRTYPGSMASCRWTSGNSTDEIDAAIDAAMKGTP